MNNLNWRRFINEKLSGRKINRWLTTGVLAGIGLALNIAFFRWAFGHPFPEIPAQGIIIAALPYAMQAWDNFMKTSVDRSMIHMGAQPSLHQHGGAAETP